MEIKFRVLNWNVAGAKYFGIKDDIEKERFRADVNTSLRRLIENDERRPDVIALQEVVEYARPGEAKRSLVDPPEGYLFKPSILIDSTRHPYVAKWRKAAADGGWPNETYFGQGLGFLWRTDLPQLKHFPVWSIASQSAKPDGEAHIEEVILMSGIYFGNRDTEPRAALVSHFVVTHDLRDSGIVLPHPMDVFVVNLHLTTLKHEREGVPAIDEKAVSIRSHQLDIILHGIVSRYNMWRSNNYRIGGIPTPLGDGEDFNRYSPVWILCGDFNFSPDSLEYQRLRRANLVDVCPAKGTGTKSSGRGNQATLTCDYIFAGPEFISLDPMIAENAVKRNPIPDYAITVSDHYPLFATVPLTPR